MPTRPCSGSRGVPSGGDSRGVRINTVLRSKDSSTSSCCGIVFAGHCTGADLASHYASADFLVFSSVTETFGNVMLEIIGRRQRKTGPQTSPHDPASERSISFPCHPSDMRCQHERVCRLPIGATRNRLSSLGKPPPKLRRHEWTQLRRTRRKALADSHECVIAAIAK